MWVKHEIVELIRCCCTDTSQLITITELAGDEEKIPTVPHSHSPVHCDFVQDVSHCMANFVIFGYFLFAENKKSYEHESCGVCRVICFEWAQIIISLEHVNQRGRESGDGN